MKITNENKLIKYDDTLQIEKIKVENHKMIAFIMATCMILIIIDSILIFNFASLIQKIQL